MAIKKTKKQLESSQPFWQEFSRFYNIGKIAESEKQDAKPKNNLVFPIPKSNKK